ncbi:glucose-6-phosphate dehydrogenase [Corynebacterium halotolerans]|uniref:Glucose-6-phosphate 1-dehydrogenase n=1 Tax=Corynebacterium halotolerans YIM 70093 = DSM 44683 TaxID=1121362 RepID=M1P8S0_9CORY|nr:glucose-6-phosphate dehydrogenase [Corynebacterium halotolerans]AGF73061.1 glucose-6-phosphate 1-dehydrogenase [Corynebacterium halotolerans YIM 70093 = DSM 44683]
MNATNPDHPKSVTFYILGGAGDLVRRLLLPGMAGYLSEYDDTRIDLVGSGRSERDDYPQLVRDSLAEADMDVDDAVVERLAERATYVVADATDPGDLRKLFDAREPGERSVLYFALSPSVTAAAVDALAEVDLPDGLILAMEKPFGEDAATAEELNGKLLNVTDEDHIFRVDHFNYETALSNLTGLVGANALFAAGWDNTDIETVEIIYDESLGLEGRAEFYDSNGAMRDMLQSHLLQVMAHALAAGSPDTATDILAATTIDPDSVRRARYTAGEIDGRRLPAYAEEEGVDPERGTETLFQVTADVDTDRWRGVPVVLRSGKAIGNPRQEIAVTYRRRGHEDELEINPGTRLIFPFTDEVAVEVNVSDHGYRQNLQRVTLRTELVPSRLTPYGRVVRAILAADRTTEVPADAPRRSWEIIEPVLAAFADGSVPLEEYPAGSQGPEGW